MAKPETFRDFCHPGITITKPAETTAQGTMFKETDRRVVAVNEDSLTVIGQGHQRHKVTRRKYRKYLKQRGIF